MNLLILLLSIVSAHGVIRVTPTQYNGSITYDGMYQACNDLDGLKMAWPCTQGELIGYKFWQYNLPLSWILSTNSMWNCIGYTTNSSNSMGHCLLAQKTAHYVTECSCDMKIGVCCIVYSEPM